MPELTSQALKKLVSSRGFKKKVREILHSLLLDDLLGGRSEKVIDDLHIEKVPGKATEFAPQFIFTLSVDITSEIREIIERVTKDSEKTDMVFDLLFKDKLFAMRFGGILFETFIRKFGKVIKVETPRGKFSFSYASWRPDRAKKAVILRVYIISWNNLTAVEAALRGSVGDRLFDKVFNDVVLSLEPDIVLSEVKKLGVGRVTAISLAYLVAERMAKSGYFDAELSKDFLDALDDLAEAVKKFIVSSKLA